MKYRIATFALMVGTAACAAAQTRQTQTATPADGSRSFDRPQFPSTYVRREYPPVLIENATILTAAGDEIENGSILFRNGIIETVSNSPITPPEDAIVVDGTGKYVTPGILAAARALGIADNYGSLESGKVASVVVWSDDPFEFSTTVNHVFIRGNEVLLTSRQQELAERYMQLPPNTNRR
ncbi:MAG: amidohydrolase family protein [Gemmatimonadota bacterium]|nr:amidohydrolase family protein [Gemmatimonadota bacterium]